MLECAAILADTVIEAEHLPAHVVAGEAGVTCTMTRCSPPAAACWNGWRHLEKQAISDAIERHGSKREAARRLGIDIATLIRKLRAD